MRRVCRLVDAYLASERESEEEVQDAVRQSAAPGMLQINFVALDQEVRILGAPVEDDPDQMILDHRDGRVGDVALLLRQACVQVFVETRAQLLDDDGRVGDLLAVQLDEWQLSLL